MTDISNFGGSFFSKTVYTETLQHMNGSLDIDSTGGAVSINSSDSPINIGNDAVAQAINVGTGAAARTISIGNATGATTLDFDAGTGGVSVDAAANSNFTTSSGTLTLNGAGGLLLSATGVDTNVKGTITVDETSIFSDTMTVNAASDMNGSLDVSGTVDLGASGGAADTTIRGSLTVNENAIITGNLTVLGVSTSVDSTTVNIGDNIVLVNSGPSGSKDAGLIVERYQTENDAGTGDVVADTSVENATAQAGDASTVTLEAGANGTDDHYNGWYIKISGGTGANQVRQISDYVGSTKVATVTTAWTTNPDATSTYNLYNKPFIGSMYDESHNEWVFAASASDPSGTVVLQDLVDLHVGGLTIDDGLDVDGLADFDVTTFAVDSTTDAADAIYLHANGGTSETIKIHSDQGTSDNSIDIVSDVGGIQLNGSAVNVVCDLNIEPTGNLNTNASSNVMIFGQNATEGSWRVRVSSDNKLTFERHNGSVWIIQSQMGA